MAQLMQLMKNKDKKVSEIVFADMLSKFKDIDELEEDAEVLEEIEEAYKLYDEGNFTRMDADTFLKELRKW